MRLAKYLEKRADPSTMLATKEQAVASLPTHKDFLINRAVQNYKMRGGLFHDSYDEDIPKDDATLKEIERYYLPTGGHRVQDYAASSILGGSFGALGGAGVTHLISLLSKKRLGENAYLTGALSGFGLGAGGGALATRQMYKNYDKLSPEEKKEMIRHYIDSTNTFNNSELGKTNKDLQKAQAILPAAGLLSSLGQTGAGVTLLGATTKLPALEQNVEKQLVDNLGLKDRIKMNRPSAAKDMLLLENAWFDPRDTYRDNLLEPVVEKDINKEIKKRPKLLGSVNATSKRMWKPGIIAHELGHANIHAGNGPVSWMQKNLYGPTVIANRLGLGVIPAAASYRLTDKDENEFVGGAKGLLTGSAINAGALVPEFEASRRGISALMKTDLPRHLKIKNALTTVPAFLTYLSFLAGPSAVLGAIHAHLNKRKRQKVQENG